MKTLGLSIAFLMSTVALQSQQVYQSYHYGGIGTGVLYSTHHADLPDSLWLSGAELTWDVSHLTPDSLVPYRIVFPPDVIDYVWLPTICDMNLYPFSAFNCFRDYSQTDHALITGDTFSLGYLGGGLEAQFQVNNDTVLTEVFFLFTLDSIANHFPFGIIYNEPDTLLSFPLTYGNTFQTVTSWDIDFSAHWAYIMHESERHRTVVVDSWGALITPYDTLAQTLRVRSEISASNTFRTDTSISHEFLTTVEYAWYDTTHSLPVMIAKGIVLDTTEIITELLYQAKIYCPVPTWSITTDSLTIYLDSSGAAEVQFYLHDSNADNYSWSFGNGFYATPAGDTSRIYTYPGVFNVTVTGCMTDCLPLDYCSSQTVTIEIIDTTTTFTPTEKDNVEVHHYPNPAQTSLYVELPEYRDGFLYLILDAQGREIQSGKATSGITEFDLSGFNNGIYAFQFVHAITNASLPVQRVLVLKN